MMLGVLITVLAGACVTVAVSPKARTLAKGFGNLFVEDLAKTPKGAQAVYLQAIDEAQKAYGQASETLNMLAGKLADTKIEHGKTEKELSQLEHKCESLAKKNDVAALKIMATKRAGLISKKEALFAQMQELQPMLQEARYIHNSWEIKIAELKSQKDLTVSELELAKSMKVIYAKMDHLRRDTATDKLLGAVNDGVRQTKQEALGAYVVHQNRIDTKITAIDRKLQDDAQDGYIQELLTKYNR